MSYLVWYALIIFSIVLLREKGQTSTLDRFLVADRKVGGTVGSMSVAASWIWAPAIFISSQTGYKWGLSGLLWFVVPNMMALIIFAPLAAKVRRSLPVGYNYIEYLKGGERSFLHTQLYLQLGMQVAIFAIQLVAGAELLAQLTGADYHTMVIGMAITPLTYTLFSGLRTSAFTDALQYIVIAGAALSLFLIFPFETASVVRRPFEPLNADLLKEFGLSSALGLLVAIFADHQQWQRAFATAEQQVVPTFYKAALFHGLVTTSLGGLGCLAYSIGFQPQKTEMIGLEFVGQFYPAIFVSLFVIMAMCALISTLDSALCAFSSLAMKEVTSSLPTLAKGRSWMVLLAICGAIVALQRPSLLTLWFIGSTIRLSSFLPTIVSIVGHSRPTHRYTIATLSAPVLGGGIFAAGIILGNTGVRTLGMILPLAISGTILAIPTLTRSLAPRLQRVERRCVLR